MNLFAVRKYVKLFFNFYFDICFGWREAARMNFNRSATRTLHLTLHRCWFDAIASGVKTEEYRDKTPYWCKRLLGGTYDEVRFRNGYASDAPMMRVECLWIMEEEERFVIRLGKILEITGWNGSKSGIVSNNLVPHQSRVANSTHPVGEPGESVK